VVQRETNREGTEFRRRHRQNEMKEKRREGKEKMKLKNVIGVEKNTERNE